MRCRCRGGLRERPLALIDGARGQLDRWPRRPGSRGRRRGQRRAAASRCNAAARPGPCCAAAGRCQARLRAAALGCPAGAGAQPRGRAARQKSTCDTLEARLRGAAGDGRRGSRSSSSGEKGTDAAWAVRATGATRGRRSRWLRGAVARGCGPARAQSSIWGGTLARRAAGRASRAGCGCFNQSPIHGCWGPVLPGAGHARGWACPAPGRHGDQAGHIAHYIPSIQPTASPWPGSCGAARRRRRQACASPNSPAARARPARSAAPPQLPPLPLPAP
jgi:hypothetical protein